jgi:hypothetical protein
MLATSCSASLVRSACCAVLLLGAASTTHANLLLNGDFEDGLANWQFFGNGTTSVLAASADTPSGNGASADLQVTVAEGLPWMVQDVAVTAGQSLVLRASVKELAPDPSDAWIAAQVWMLPNSSSGFILASAAMFFSSPDWTTQEVALTAPAGANVARVLFNIQNTAFGVGTGRYLIDDVSLNVPEPTAAASACLASLVIAGARRRRRS